MKLLYVIEHISTIGGLERILIEKMNALAADDGFEIVLMTVWQDDNKPAFPLDKRVGQVCLNVRRPKISLGMLTAIPRVVSRYNKLVRTISPDVVVHFRAIGAMLISFSLWRGYTVFEAHTTRVFSNHRWLYPIMERRVDAVVCLTKQDAENYTRAKRVKVIPNFSPIHNYGSFDSTVTKRRCLFVGRLCPEKNPLKVVRLWRDVVEKHPDWTLDIYGTGELENYVRMAIREFGVVDKVVMHGNTHDIVSAYAKGSILLLASRTEGFPMVLIEAMQCGLPVVSFDCPCGPRDIIQNGENGFLVNQDDDAAFVKSVSMLIENHSLRERMGRMALETSLVYQKDAIIDCWKEFFKKNEDIALRRI